MDARVLGGVIHYEVVNPKEKETLLVLHGWGQSGEDWRAWAETLPKNYRIILPDLPAFGLSTYTNEIVSLSAYIKVLLDFIDQITDSPLNLIGHSFGGSVGLLLAAEDSAKIARLLLVAPAVIRRQGWLAVPYRLISWLSRFKQFLPRRLYFAITDGRDYAQASDRQKELMRLVIRTDLTKKAAEVIHPVLVIVGEKDREILGNGQQVVSLFQHGRLKVLYNTGHQLHLDKPTELRQEIIRFIQT